MNEEQKEGDNQNTEKKRNRWLELDGRRQIAFFVAGAYLVYLGIKVLTSISQEPTAARVIPIIAAVAFILAGGALMVCCVMSHIIQLKETQKNSADENGADKNDEEKE